MEESSKQELLESTVLDTAALDSFREEGTDFDMPLWMVVMVALLFALAGIGAMKTRTKDAQLAKEKS